MPGASCSEQSHPSADSVIGLAWRWTNVHFAPEAVMRKSNARQVEIYFRAFGENPIGFAGSAASAYKGALRSPDTSPKMSKQTGKVA